MGLNPPPSVPGTDSGDVQAIIDADSRMTNARTPTGHHVTHETGGMDALTLAQAQVTDLVTALAALQAKATFPVCIGVALSDETTAITTGTAKATIRAPYAFTLAEVRASLTTVSSSGTPTVDINEGGTTVLSTKLTIDASEKTSTTAATPAVISDASIADDAEITFDIDVAGTDATGLKVWLLGTRVAS